MNRSRFKSAWWVLWLLLFVVAPAAADSGAVRARLDAAFNYVALGWYEQAVAVTEEAVNEAPLHVEARTWLALLQHAYGSEDAALWQYDLIRSLDGDSAGLAVFMGDIRLGQGDARAAKQLYEQALAADDRLGLAYYGLGRALERLGEEGADDAYTRGVEAAPDLVDMRFRLGRLLRLRGDYEGALEHLLHANGADSSLAPVRFELGLTYEALGRLSAAEHEYRAALRLSPEHEEARRRLAALPES